MRVVSDTSVIVAVIAGEPDRDRLIELTQGADLIRAAEEAGIDVMEVS